MNREPFGEEYNAMARAENEKDRALVEEAIWLNQQVSECLTEGNFRGANEFAMLAIRVAEEIQVARNRWKKWLRQHGHDE